MDNTDRLKEIRDKQVKYMNVMDGKMFSEEQVEQIQSETLDYGKQLGREEVINEIEPILKKIWELAYGKTVNYIQLRNDLRAEYKKLNSLKNP